MKDEELNELSEKYDSVYLCRDTARSALLAAGLTVALSKAIAKDVVGNGFAFVRPPGHHAEHDHAMGFCIYNNVAVAAKTLLKQELAQRILIVDWDVHHGNGTQNAFIDDPQVLFISIHRHEDGRFYPHNELAGMTCVGEGEGKGRNVNIPWPSAGFGDADYLYAFTRIILPIAQEFNPDFVFVSAGFDAAIGDPIGECLVSPAGFAHMTQLLKTLAGGKVLLVLEGGYNVKVVADCSEACTRSLLGQPAPRFTSKLVPSPAAVSVIESVVRIHSAYWNCLAPRQIDFVQANPLVGSLSLQSVLDSHWSHLCKIKFDLLPLSIIEESFVETFQGRVHVSDGLLNAPKTIVVFAHETGPVVQGLAPSNGSNFLDNTVDNSVATYQVSFLPLLEEIKRSVPGCQIIDIHVPARSWKLKQTSAAPPDELALYNQFFHYLWDNYIDLSGATSIFFISSGLCSYAISKLVESKEVESKVKGILVFSSTLFLPIVPQEKGPWYQKVSKVFVPGTEKPLGSPLATADVFGSCFSIGPNDPAQKLLAPANLKKDITDFISSRL